MAGQILQFPFSIGVDENADPKTAPPGTLTTAVNVEWTKEGHLETRAGTKLLANTGLSVIKKIITRGAELCVTDGSSLYSFSANNAAWTNMGSLPELGVTWKTSLAPVTGVQASDSAVLANGAVVQAWVSGDPTDGTSVSNNVYYQMLDAQTGACIVSPSRIGQVGLTSYTGRAVRVAATGNSFMVAFVANGGKVITSTNGATAQALRTDARYTSYPCAFDLRIIGGNAFIAYEKANGSQSLVAVYKYTIANPPVELANTTVSGEVGANSTTVSYNGISVDGAAGESIYVGYVGYANGNASAQSAMIACFNETLSSQTLGATVVDAAVSTRGYLNLGLARANSNACAYAYSYSSGNVSDPKGVRTWFVSNTGTATCARGISNTLLLTRPVALNGKFYITVADDGRRSNVNSGQPTSFILEQETYAGLGGTGFRPPRVVGMLEPLSSGEWTLAHVSSPTALPAANTVAFVMPYQEIASPYSALWRQGTRLVTLTSGNAAPDSLWTSAELMNETHIAGGKYTVYDGRRPFEHGFSRSYLDPAAFSTGANGGLTTNSNYIYSVVTEYQSEQGVIYRSPAAIPFTQPTSTSNSVRVAICPAIEWKRTIASDDAGDPIYPVHFVYRTEANGTVLHRLAISPTSNSSQQGAVANDPTSTPQTLWDTEADANGGFYGIKYQLAARPVLYTLGELDDFAPVANLTTRLHKNRLWVLAGDKRTLWVSKDFTTNIGTAPGFHPTQVIPFDQDIVGIESMDDKLLVWSATCVWYVIGDGPAPNGDGGFDVIKLQSDTGLVTARSLCSGPMGVVYQSPRGIYLMDRGFQQTWIGKPVRDQLAAYPTITSAVLVPAKNQIRISCNNAAGTAGIVLVYDYARGQWTTFQYAGTPAIADAALVNGVYTFATVGGSVYQEDTTTYLDAGATYVGWDVESAWISADGPLGYQRVKRIDIRGDQQTAADVRFRIAVNDSASYAQDHTFTSDVIAGLADSHVLGLTTKVQKCRSFRFRLTATTPTNGGAVANGRGMTLSAIGFEIVPKGEMDRRAPAATG